MGDQRIGFGSVNRFIGYSLVVTTNNYYTNTDFHTLKSTFALALGFSVSTSRLLATNLNTEINTSNHYEIFLLFRLQSLWNLGTKNSSGLTPPAYDWLVTSNS
jgi:hypothetical protein